MWCITEKTENGSDFKPKRTNVELYFSGKNCKNIFRNRRSSLWCFDGTHSAPEKSFCAKYTTCVEMAAVMPMLLWNALILFSFVVVGDVSIKNMHVTGQTRRLRSFSWNSYRLLHDFYVSKKPATNFFRPCVYRKRVFVVFSVQHCLCTEYYFGFVRFSLFMCGVCVCWMFTVSMCSERMLCCQCSILRKFFFRFYSLWLSLLFFFFVFSVRCMISVCFHCYLF